MRVAQASFTCTLPDGTCIPGWHQLSAPPLPLTLTTRLSDVVGMLRAAQASAGEVLGAAAVSVGVRCAH